MNAFIGLYLLLFKFVLFEFKTNSSFSSCCRYQKISEPKIVEYIRTKNKETSHEATLIQAMKVLMRWKRKTSQ